MNKQRLIAFIFIIIAGVMATQFPIAPANAQTDATATADPTPIPVPTRDLRFGIVEGFWEPTETAELAPGWDRILFYWREIQPDDADDWNTLHVYEEWLAEADAQGRQVMGLLKNTPAWATDGLPESGLPRGLYLPPDDPENLWANYVRRIARYYGPLGVHHWIIWNEPDILLGEHGHEFTGDEADYYQLVKVAYTVLKEEDPEAVIHLGGLTYWHDVANGRRPYLERFLEVVAADPEAEANDYFFDAITLHIYYRVETVPSIVSEMDAIQQKFGLDKEIWVNETNTTTAYDPEWWTEVPPFPINLEQQAYYLVQAYGLGFAAGADSIGTYKLIDIHLPGGMESFGMMRPDKSKRPVYFAYRTIVEQLSGFTAVSQQSDWDHYLLTFDMPDGVTHLLWARSGKGIVLDVPATMDEAVLVGIDGVETAVTPISNTYSITLPGAICTPEECLTGGEPFFLVEKFPPTPTPTATAMATATASPTPTTPATIAPTSTPLSPTATTMATIAPAETPVVATPMPTETAVSPPEDGVTANASYLLFGIAGILTAVGALIWWKRK